ncbi:MAG: hypothetical protein HQL95_12640 [Magnetococcales bacterium]|nr:hypothetical protein [Magnetococcales bacterium]
MLRTLMICGILANLTVPMAQAAETDGIAFSAEVIRTRGDKRTQTRGKLHVSPEGIRGETTRNGTPVIMIHNTARKTVWMVQPAKKSYTERTGVEQKRPALPDETGSPCRMDKNVLCRQVGTEQIEGRRVVHWEIAQRGPDNREIPQAHLWVDPRLKMAIRERYADGMQVELTSIQEGPQPAELFVVPVDFQKITPEAPQP